MIQALTQLWCPSLVGQKGTFATLFHFGNAIWMNFWTNAAIYCRIDQDAGPHLLEFVSQNFDLLLVLVLFFWVLSRDTKTNKINYASTYFSQTNVRHWHRHCHPRISSAFLRLKRRGKVLSGPGRDLSCQPWQAWLNKAQACVTKGEPSCVNDCMPSYCLTLPREECNDINGINALQVSTGSPGTWYTEALLGHFYLKKQPQLTICCMAVVQKQNVGSALLS